MNYSSVLLLLTFTFSTIFGFYEDKAWLYYPISNWTRCDPQCRTYRKLICIKYSECGVKIIREDAYCYENYKCKKYVMLQIKQNTTHKNDLRKRNAVPSRAKCKRSQNAPITLKILGGVQSKRNKWPWHVALINDFREVYCAGTLISPRWVLTAAHCIRRSMHVRLNEYDLHVHDRGELDVHIAHDRIHVHPEFNQRTVDSDIALLQLPRAVDMPVACLPTSKPKPRRKCSIMGWGKVTMKNEYGTRFLHEAQISIMRQRTCRQSYREFYLTTNMFCAGVQSGKVDTCGGDSGGGLMCPKHAFSKSKKNKNRIYYTVEGITSFGDGCGIKEKYGIYTLVHNFVPWIKRTIYNET